MDLIPDLGNFAYTVIVFVIALLVIVTIHEFGHYIVGRWTGIKADVFSVGFGPVLVSRVDRHGTRWQIAALPLGGYVKFRGDADAASAGPDTAALSHMSAQERRHTMHGAPLWARALTVAAGPAFNFILSILVIAGLMMWTGTATKDPVVGSVVALPDGAGGLRAGDRIVAVDGRDTPDYPSLGRVVDTLPDSASISYRVARDGREVAITGPQLFPPRFAGVAPQSAAYQAGLQEGDVITAVDGTPVTRFQQLQHLVQAGNGAPLALTVWRPSSPDQPLTLTLTPKRTDLPTADGGFENRWLIGATGSFVFAPQTRPTGLTEALAGASTQTWGIITQSVSGLVNMVAGNISSCNLRGAIGIAQGSAAAAKSGLESFIWFIAVLSTAVGFLNLFPIPVLDGGHLMFHCYEAITGKPPSERVMNALMAVGLVLVLSLMLFGLSNDIFCP
ncbi:RIP metalloprotease RseP [Rhodobacteraceae bacterium]|nr:RIP metalloprotease RseP [Paracoccaceae bacterium]